MSTKPGNWAALDVLRGLAVAFMLVNHAAVNWLNAESASSGVSGALNFIGSFAPALFFLSTGIGYGLAHVPGKPANSRDVFIKAFILILADIFMRGGAFTTIGWDFLAFIAFSMILLHGFRGRQHGFYAAILLALTLLFIRFGLGAAYDKLVVEQQHWHRVVLGLSAMEGVSYWFTPWFVYPLVGFVMGVLAKRLIRQHDAHLGKTSLMLFCLGALCTGLCVALWAQGAGLFRWGTMSLNFFVASVACVFLSLSLVIYIAEQRSMQTLTPLVSMQGVSSLAVVPIHYFCLDLLSGVMNSSLGESLYLMLMPLWLVVCFFAARLTNTLVQKLTSSPSPRLFYALIGAVFVFAIMCILWSGHAWMFVITFAAQYVLCILLGFSYAKR